MLDDKSKFQILQRNALDFQMRTVADYLRCGGINGCMSEQVIEDYRKLKDLSDVRGRSIEHRVLLNYEDSDFTGCVLYRCFPRGIPGAIEVDPADSIADVGFSGIKSSVELIDLNLRGVNFEGSVLSGELSNLNLTGTNFKSAHIENMKITNVNFDSADLEGLDLRNAWIQNINLQNANLKNANIIGPSITLESGEYPRIDAEDACFEGARIFRLEIDFSVFKNANFQKAILLDTVFRNSDLENADFRGADLRGANISGNYGSENNTRGAIFTGAVYDSLTELPRDLTLPQLESMIFVDNDED